jgi:hypothetical protein
MERDKQEELDKIITEALKAAKTAYAKLIEDKTKDEANLIAFHFSQAFDCDMAEARLMEGMKQHTRNANSLRRA